MDITNQLPTHILNHLLNNEDYCRRVIPYLEKEYFEGTHKTVFDLIAKFVAKHNKLPSGKILDLELRKIQAPDDILNNAAKLISEIREKSDIDTDYLIKESEKWCKDRAVYIAIMNSIQIIDGKNKEKSEGAIPEILSNALGVSFDQAIGHDYIDNSEERYDFYNRVEERISWDLDYFNKITKGGIPNKTLNICLAGTGVGKSLFMCHCAASVLEQGKNVLYITMEMAEERIAERIDANLMDLPIHQLESLSKNVFNSKIQKIAQASIGKLIIKEYPTGAAHTGHFRALLNELKLKKKFAPDIIYVDYLNICSSSRMKAMGGSINSYTYIKAIAEELRGLAIEFNVPIVSATQTTRSGYSNTDVGLEDTSESFGLPATADLMFALISTEELEEMGQLMVKQLKNRYNDPTSYRRFVIGVDRSRMKLYDVEESAQTDLIGDSSSIPDKPIATWGDRENKDTFADFNI
jgi:replicative DNA helicase|tara:strand:- start:2018 stop:3415 length:1398 start_codon:yes stop_codon:yes gene_type:complete